MLICCNTIRQFVLRKFLERNGLSPQAISDVGLPDANSIEIRDYSNDRMTARLDTPGVVQIRYLIDGVQYEEFRNNPDVELITASEKEAPS